MRGFQGTARAAYEHIAVPVSNYTRSHTLGACLNTAYPSILARNSGSWTEVNGGGLCVGVSGNGVGEWGTSVTGHGFSLGGGFNMPTRYATR